MGSSSNQEKEGHFYVFLKRKAISNSHNMVNNCYTNLFDVCRHHQYACCPAQAQLIAIVTPRGRIYQSLFDRQCQSSHMSGFQRWYRPTPEATHRDIASVQRKSYLEFLFVFYEGNRVTKAWLWRCCWATITRQSFSYIQKTPYSRPIFP